MRCQGCGYALASGRETFGGIGGPAFCFDCYAESLALAVLRRPLLREREHCVETIECCELEIAEAVLPNPPGDMRGTQYRLAAEVAADSARERLGDIDEELACLTVPFQRRFSVIGRAA